MTVRVTTLKGPTAGVYYVDGLPKYYLDAEGEPPGVWHGHGAAQLGLDAALVDGDFLAVMAGTNPHTGTLLGREYEERSVRGFDVTASAPKSVSVLWALGDEHVRGEVVAAHDAAVAAMIVWIESHAHTRYRIAGQVAVVDAEGIVAGVFRQHTSRALDPQLHSHVVIANRVLSDDGRWLALDARTLKLDQRSLSAIYHVGLRAELTSRLGVRWNVPVNAIGEIDGVPDRVLREFSSRTVDVADRVDTKLARFETTMGRKPTARERWRLEREAVVDSRPSKPAAVDAASLHARWAKQAARLGIEPERLIRDVTRRVESVELTAGTMSHMTVDALSALEAKQSSWRPAEIVRELAAATPTTIGHGAAVLVPFLDQLAADAEQALMLDISGPIPDGVRLRRDGRPVTESAADRALTTEGILQQEETILAWAEQRLTQRGILRPEAVARSRIELSRGQAECATAVAGTAALVLVVGPAGSGKTTALRPAIEQLEADHRTVFGVAPSAVAADVLQTETGVNADTVDKLLIEHTLMRGPLPRFALAAGATVIVDEAAMMSTPKLAELAALADAKQWRVVLVGDPRQFSAVGRGGMYTMLTETNPDTVIELDTVHRFEHAWERDASLRLRRGDVDVLDVYETHGRIHSVERGDAAKAILDAWQHVRHNGESVALLATSNDTVQQLNTLAQRRRITAGELDQARHVTAGVYRVHVGDRIVTRRNDRDLQTDRGLTVHNRDEWTVTKLHRSGAVTATGNNGTIRLPAGYVNDDVELGYAQTSHAAQGRTVDHSLLLIDGPTDQRGVYVPMTRGRTTNHVYVTIDENHTARDTLETALSQDWIDRPAHLRRSELNPPPDMVAGREREPLASDDIRRLLETEHELSRRIDAHDAAARRVPATITAAEQAHRDAINRYNRFVNDRDQAQATLDRYDRVFHRRDHTTHIATAKRDRSIAESHLGHLRTAIDDRARDIDDAVRHAREIEHEGRRRPQWQSEIDAARTAIRVDLEAREQKAVHMPSLHALAELEPRPRDPHRAKLWNQIAARIDQHHTAYPHYRPDRENREPSAYKRSHDNTQAWTAILDKALHPEHEIEQQHQHAQQHQHERTHDHGIEM